MLRPIGNTYSESLQVVESDTIAEQVEEGILKHATVTIPVTAATSASMRGM